MAVSIGEGSRRLPSIAEHGEEVEPGAGNHEAVTHRVRVAQSGVEVEPSHPRGRREPARKEQHDPRRGHPLALDEGLGIANRIGFATWFGRQLVRAAPLLRSANAMEGGSNGDSGIHHPGVRHLPARSRCDPDRRTRRAAPPVRQPPPEEIWIRVVGMLVAFLGFYYVRAAAAGLSAFFAWTVPVRLSVPAFFVAFIVLLSAPPTLLLFGLVDAAAAVWTWRALRATRS